MLTFLIPLFLSFLFNIGSAFTAAFSRRFGRRKGQFLSTWFRNVLGLPLLGVAFFLAARLPAPRVLPRSAWVGAVGWLLLIAGALIILWALTALGWPAASPSVGDTLVRSGPYGLVRHPLYDGVLGELAGAALLRPTWPIWLCCALTAGWAIVQARAEEYDLQQRLSGYQTYQQQVPRFIPRWRKG